MAKAVPEFLSGCRHTAAHTNIQKVVETPTSFSSRVEGAKKRDIPRSLGFLVGFVRFALFWFLCIYKIISIVVQSLAHNERSLPWR
jgi:hypothetical protein